MLYLTYSPALMNIQHPDRERFPVVDFGSCIHCYCCESYCKQNAISIRGSAVNMLMRGVRQLLKL